VKIDVFNLQGQMVRMLAEQNILPGEHRLKWDGSDGGGSLVQEGVYMVRISTKAASGSYTESRQVQIIR
jgi:flagellar hook assembly protein FlgD